jgi:hypothetical protein
MSDIAYNASNIPQWKQLCIAALAERDPIKVPERIAVARSAVLDQIEDKISQPSSRKQLVLGNALQALDVLRQIVQRKIVKRQTLPPEVDRRWTGTC